MKGSGGMKHIFVVNPIAGEKPISAEKMSSIIDSSCKDIDYSVYSTKGRGDAWTYVKKRCEQAKDDGETVRFYACGGDGTLNEVVNGAVGFSNVSVTNYPCGSGNDFIKYYGVREDFLRVCELVDGVETPIDLILIGDRYCVNVCNFGFDTVVAETADRMRGKNRGGKSGYMKGVARAFITAMKTRCRIAVGDEVVCPEELLSCTISNGRYVGGSFKCAPNSLNNDGMMDICVVKPISRLKFVKLLKPYTAGKHLEDPAFSDCLTYRQGKKVKVSGESGFRFSLDGELIDMCEFIAEIIPSAINFVIPKRLAAGLSGSC